MTKVVDFKLKNNMFQTGLFDKRDSFPFSIVRMPRKSSKIPSNIFYMSTEAECLETARVCNNQNSFLNSINPLERRMISQEAKKMPNSSRPFKIFQQTSKVILTML